MKRQIREGGQRQPGAILADRYKLIEVIGKGGFAKVWKAWDRKGRRLVALKMLHGQYNSVRTRLERFFRGARLMAKLRHPGIARVIEEHGIDEGFHFFVMDFWGGCNSAQAILEGAISRETALEVIRHVGEALHHAHEQGLVHRDVKPQNILLDGEGKACLTDLDLVIAADTTGGTQTNAGLGTYLFAAPELMSDADCSGPEADVYGLGTTAWSAIHGRTLSPLDVYQNRRQLIDALPCALNLKYAIAKAAELS